MEGMYSLWLGPAGPYRDLISPARTRTGDSLRQVLPRTVSTHITDNSAPNQQRWPGWCNVQCAMYTTTARAAAACGPKPHNPLSQSMQQLDNATITHKNVLRPSLSRLADCTALPHRATQPPATQAEPGRGREAGRSCRRMQVLTPSMTPVWPHHSATHVNNDVVHASIGRRGHQAPWVPQLPGNGQPVARQPHSQATPTH
jgi:hypothetical protein